MEQPKFEIVGIIKVMGCCLFTWREQENGGTRVVEIESTHCERCIAELKKMPGRPITIVDLRPQMARDENEKK